MTLLIKERIYMSDPLTRLRVNRPARHTVMNVRTASRGGQVTGREIASTAWRPWPFWTIATTLFLFLFGAGAPSPLYVVYQQRFGFSATTLTAIFAVYSLALLVTMIPAGTLSDQIGRRPVILGAIALQAVAMVLFLLADGTAMLFAARIVQGVASGAALGTLNAALVDFQPVGSARGPLIGSLAQTIGLALGAVGSGALVQLGVAPLRLVYWVQLAALALAAVVILLAVPETIIASATRVRLQFRVRVPLEARHPFTALAPGLIAGWALTGLFLSLGPSLALVLLHSHSHVIGGLLPATFFFLSAPASVATRNWSGRLAVLSGTLLLAAGALVTLAGIRTSSPVLLFGGSAVVGLGFGPAFVGTLRTLAPLASPSARGGLFAAVFVVSYLALAVPAVLAGLATTRWGLRDSASGCAIILVLLALAAAALTARPPRASGTAGPAR
jgi:predicted MFS family arabinose efflux permease